MRLNLNPAKVRRTIQKNTATSFGLTLVIGLPFPKEIADQIESIQQQLEALAPASFTWYSVEHLHATLLAPLRGRYRKGPPLQREELPADLEGFACDLADFFTQLKPFPLGLAGVSITAGGLVVVRENTLEQQLMSGLQRHPEFDKPKHCTGLHISFGFLNEVLSFDTDEQLARFEVALDELMYIPVGQVMVQRVWLVHYASRTLNRIKGKVPFTLGSDNALTAERLIHELGVVTVQPPGRSTSL